MSPEICFTSKTSNCVEFGAEIKCTWSLLRCHTDQAEDAGMARRGTGSGRWSERENSENFSTHTCTHSLAINLLPQENKGDAVRVSLHSPALYVAS